MPETKQHPFTLCRVCQRRLAYYWQRVCNVCRNEMTLTEKLHTSVEIAEEEAKSDELTEARKRADNAIDTLERVRGEVDKALAALRDR